MTLGTDVPAFRPSGRSHPRAEARHLVSLSAGSGPSNRFIAYAQNDKMTSARSPPLLFLHAANGETVRTAVVVLGGHAGTVEAQARPVHARRRRRRTAPGVTARAHTEQVAGPAVADTRSGDDVSAPPSLIPARSERGNRSNGCCCTRGSRRNCGSSSTTRTRSTPSKANCSRRNRLCLHCPGRRKSWRGNLKRGCRSLYFWYLQSCPPRTGKPYERLLLLSGPTTEL